jgi:phosphoribosylformimino-5-aminoimidazole carboxamide ribotide isomerase
MEIIPAIDIIDGKCVRLSAGDFARKTVYDEDPVELAKRFENVGLRRLHIVDLDGAKEARIKNLAVLERIAAGSALVIDFGGGIRSDIDVRSVLDAGARMVSIGSVAVKDRDSFCHWLEHIGPERFILGADVRGTSISINGWQTSTEIQLIPFLANYLDRGLSQAFVTDISRDGQLLGPSIELYQQVLTELPDLKLIASGGIASIEDVDRLEQIGCSGAIVGKAIYEGKITLEQLSEYVS